MSTLPQVQKILLHISACCLSHLKAYCSVNAILGSEYPLTPNWLLPLGSSTSSQVLLAVSDWKSETAASCHFLESLI